MASEAPRRAGAPLMESDAEAALAAAAPSSSASSCVGLAALAATMLLTYSPDDPTLSAPPTTPR